MELTIKITDKKSYESLLIFLLSIGIKVVPKQSSKKPKISGITKISQKALSEEWDSEEDEKWDEVL